MTGDDAFVLGNFRKEVHPPSRLDGGDIGFAKPYGYLDPDGEGIAREHEFLKRLVPQLVIADCRNDERGGFGRRVLPDIDNGMRGVGER